MAMAASGPDHSLVPLRLIHELFPERTFLAPRASLADMKWATQDPVTLEFLTGSLIAVIGEMPLICHRNVATQVIRDLMASAGHSLPSGIHCYESEAEAIGLARDFLDAGWTMASPFLPLHPLERDGHLLVSSELYSHLNNKASMAELVSQENMPPFKIFARREFDAVATVFLPDAVYIKVCHPGPSGAGVGVFYCRDRQDRVKALESIIAHSPMVDQLRVEIAANVRQTWCVNLAIKEEGVFCLGAAIQLLDRPGHQLGSLIDPEDEPSTDMVHRAIAVGRKARAKGFRGVAGFDMGVTADGDSLFFDLNFRTVGCTSQVLLHPAAVRRAGDPRLLSRSWSRRYPGSIDALADRLTQWFASGRLIPLRLYEASGASEGFSLLAGMLMAESLQDCQSLEEAIDADLGTVSQVRSSDRPW